MRGTSIFAACVLVILGTVEASAQDVKATAHFAADVSVRPVLLAEVTSTGSGHSTAIQGISVPTPGFGFGARLEGGHVGVYAYADDPSSSSHSGVRATARNGRYNLGLDGNAEGNSESWGSWGVIGSGTCPGSCAQYGVYASGDLAYTGSLIGPPSDLMFKREVKEHEGGLSDLLNLEVVTYQYTLDPGFAHMNLPKGAQVGFIAQQVAKVFPELVADAMHPPKFDTESGDDIGEPIRYKAIKVTQLIPILVEAIQEQQAQIERLQNQIALLERRLNQ